MTKIADVSSVAPFLELTRDRASVYWLWGRTLFLTRHGSHAYGTNIEGSDEDFKGFCVPPKEYLLGYSKSFFQAEFHKPDPDMVVFSVSKFFKLAADCNPNAIEILYTDPADHKIVHPMGAYVLQCRDLFLSKKAKYTFSGYAVSQLKRIVNHKRWLDSGIERKPTRADFGLPDMPTIPVNQRDAVEAMVRKKVESWDVDFAELDDAARLNIIDRVAVSLAEQQITSDAQWGAAARTFGLSEQFIEITKNERRYSGAMKEWESYERWKTNRNPARAEIEKKYGYDTKHGMHLVRLMRMGREILAGEGVHVRRPDAEELLEIRRGSWSYDKITSWAETQEKALEEAYLKSPLPSGPDHAKLDALLITVIDEFL